MILISAGMLTAGSAAADWTVAKVSGKAWAVSKAAGQVRMVRGMELAPGTTIATWPGSRAVLVNGADQVVLAPGTTLIVPFKPDRGMETTLLQQSGEIDVSVHKQGKPHFSVQTPFLAAVVKGTRFTVNIAEDGAGVAVREGLVGVADLSTGSTVDVARGQRADVSPGAGGLSVSGAGSLPEVQAGIPQAVQIAAPGAPVQAGLSGAASAKAAEKAAKGAAKAADKAAKATSKAAGKSGTGGSGGKSSSSSGKGSKGSGGGSSGGSSGGGGKGGKGGGGKGKSK